MKVPLRASIGLLLAIALFAGCSKIKPINAPALHSGRASYGVVAAMGTNITAGYQSGGLVDRHQTHSFVTLFAQQVGAARLDIPTISGDGIPPLLRIRRLLPPPTLIDSIGRTTGDSTNFMLPTAYHNMGVPGALLSDASDTSFYYLAARGNRYFGIVARHQGSIARQVATHLNPPPTFILFEYGSNELLGPATRGSGLPLVPAGSFTVLLGRALDTLAVLLPTAKGAILNVPDLTSLPFFTTLTPYQLDSTGNIAREANGRPKFLLGPFNVPLTANDYVLLRAGALVAGSPATGAYGYPSGTFSYLSGARLPGNNIGLADSMVLSSSEALNLLSETRRYNNVIAAEVAKRELALVDLNGLLRRIATTGIEWRGNLYTSKFVTGGMFSLDGVHPNDFAHAWICNALIDAVNAKFGSDIQRIDPTPSATLTSSRAGTARLGEPGLPPCVLKSGELLNDIFPWRGAAVP